MPPIEHNEPVARVEPTATLASVPLEIDDLIVHVSKWLDRGDRTPLDLWREAMGPGRNYGEGYTYYARGELTGSAHLIGNDENFAPLRPYFLAQALERLSRAGAFTFDAQS